MDRHLFLYDVKRNWVLFAVVMAVSAMYFTVICGMYDPAGNEELVELASLKMSPEMLRAFGFEIMPDSDLVSFLSSYLYGMLMLILPFIYTNVVSVRLLAGHADDGSMAFLLSLPVSRRKIAFTQAAFLWLSMFLMLALVTVYAVLIAGMRFPGLLSVGDFIMVNVGLLGLMTLVSGIGYAASACCGNARTATAVAVGLPLFFYVLKMAGDASEKVEWLRYFTVYSLYENTRLAAGDVDVLKLAVMFVAGFALYAVGMAVFCRKDMSV